MTEPNQHGNPIRRYVGLHHIAFFRAHLEQTVPLEDLGIRYLETGEDLAAAKRTLRMVEKELITAARRRGRNGAAMLLRVPRSSFVTGPDLLANIPTRTLPSLEEYREEIDPHEFLSERELLQRYADDYCDVATKSDTGQTEQRIWRRNLRLLEKKIRLVNELSEEIARNPLAVDLIEGWFDQRVARRLTAVGLTDLQSIVDMMNHRGNRWYTTIPRLGKVTAARIVAFLQDLDLGGEMSSFALVPRRKLGAQTGLRPLSDVIVPLDNIRSPAELNGSLGKNRAPLGNNKISAQDDLAAVHAWLNLYSGSTERAYRKEAERLVLWSIYEKSSAFSSLTTEDVAQYVAFLEDPQPAERWVAAKKFDRFHPAWRPFVAGGLSRKSIAYAITVLGGLCTWLVGRRYLDSNPFDGLPTYKVDRGMAIRQRRLSVAQWNHAREVLKGLPQAELDTIRTRFVVKLAYSTGLRLHELAQAKLGDLRMRQLGDDTTPSYYLHVVGKGEREREVPLPLTVRRELEAYLRSRNYSFDALRDLSEDVPLIARLEDGTHAMSERGIYELLKRFFAFAADKLVPIDPESAATLREASTHWLRHTHATHALRNNVSLTHVRDNLGHASLSTTSAYLHSEDAERHRETEAFVNANDF